VDFSCVVARPTSKEEIDQVMKEAAQGALKGILKFSDEPLVSMDFNHDAASSIYDSTLTKVTGGTFVKALAWYDNEWGFSNRMLDTTVAWMNAK
ncbi:MAG: erythrose-4-phosphate dehydrogenase, partial [Azospira oryzae]